MFSFSQFGSFQIFECWKIHYSVCKQYVGAGKSFLISISDGLGPYIFCHKLESTPRMREEKDGKVFFTSESTFRLRCFNIVVIFPICTLTWRESQYVSRQEKSVSRMNENTTQVLLLLDF